MEASDWAQLGITANDIFIQDYVLTHPGAEIPRSTTASVNLPGIQASFNTNVAIIAIAIVALLIFTSK